MWDENLLVVGFFGAFICQKSLYFKPYGIECNFTLGPNLRRFKSFLSRSLSSQCIMHTEELELKCVTNRLARFSF